MRIVEDPAASGRLKAFLRQHALLSEPRSEQFIRSEVGQVDRQGQRTTLPAEVVEAMVDFEHRFGGISYKLVVGNPTEYGLRSRSRVRLTEQGWAFTAIADGDLTWSLDVLIDGRVAVDYSQDIKYRVLNRSVLARLESHALLAEVLLWPHRSFEFAVPNETVPSIGSAGLPAAVPEASGHSVFWWYDGNLAFFAELHSWIYDGMDRWNLWAFAIESSRVRDVRLVPAFEAIQPTESAWCYLCGDDVSPGQTCVPDGRDTNAPM